MLFYVLAGSWGSKAEEGETGASEAGSEDEETGGSSKPQQYWPYLHPDAQSRYTSWSKGMQTASTDNTGMNSSPLKQHLSLSLPGSVVQSSRWAEAEVQRWFV